MKVRSTSAPKEQPEEGAHFARLLSIVDLGHQPGFEYAGKEIKSAYKLRLTYELVNHKMEDGRPFVVSEDVTNSDNEKSTLAARVKTLKGSFDDILGMLGKPCTVTVTHNSKGYANVSGQGAVSQVPGGMDVPALTNPTYHFSTENPDLEVFNSLPEFIQNRIKENLDFDGSPIQKALASATAF